MKNNYTHKGFTTLDKQHVEVLNKINDNYHLYEKKRKELKNIKEEYKKLQEISKNRVNELYVHQLAKYNNKIIKLNDEIKNIEEQQISFDYINTTSKHLIDYYNDKQEICCIENSPEYNSQNIIETNELNQTDIFRFLPSENKILTKVNVYEEYQKSLINEDDLSDKINRCTQEGCSGINYLPVNFRYLVCEKCGYCSELILLDDKNNSDKQMQDNNTYAYKRKNHLTEIINQLQGKETTNIDEKIFINIKKEIKKRKLNINDIGPLRLKKILKKLNYNKYYEHTPHILQIINGKKPLKFSLSDEKKIKGIFDKSQKPFDDFIKTIGYKFSSDPRKNFLNYNYFLRKACELLELDKYIPYFPLLKNKIKLLQHDQIWEKICAYNSWYYYKSF